MKKTHCKNKSVDLKHSFKTELILKETKMNNSTNKKKSKKIEKGKKIQVLEFDEFLRLLGITEEQLNEMPAEDYEYLMDDKYKREKTA